ncbi:MAG: DUF5916 domain-containing protein [Saprospiraceae bacterium]
MHKIVVLIIAFLTHQMVLCTEDPLTLTKLSSPITFDGIVDEEVWETIDPVPLIMAYPNFNGEMTEKTEIRIAYDENYVYLSGKNYDSAHDKIMANTKKRDALSSSTCYFGIIIDSFNDKENACAFFTTPTGLRLDAQVINDGLGRNPINVSWNNYWDVKTSKDEKGWYVEMRIPFTSLPFRPSGDQVKMGMTVWRYIARKGEMQIFPKVSPDYGDWSTWRPSLTQEVSMNGIKTSKPLYITPYVLVGLDQKQSLSDSENGYIQKRNIKKEIGIDIKYGINNNWNIDVSINTDFAQVEVDDQQVNLSRFSLFFPEKRLFFQERSGVFNFGMDRSNQLFYSRRIGLDSDGNQQRILGGARLVGKSGAWDFGLINMHTHDNDVQNGENFTVLRAKTKIFNPTSDAGILITNRIGLDGAYNTSYGLDASINLVGQDFLNIRWAQSFDGNLENNNPFSLDPSFLKILLSRNTNRGFSYGLSASFAGKDFNPGLGFQQRENYFRLGNRTQYSFAPKDSKIFRHGFSSGGVIHWNKDSKEVESLFWRMGWNINWNNNMKVEISYRPRIENLQESFNLSDDVTIAAGRYDFGTTKIQFTSPGTNKLFTSVELEFGKLYDGNFTKIETSPSWSVNSSFELTASYEYNKAHFVSRDEIFKAHLFGLKALYMFSTKLSIATFIQYNSLDETFGGNFRFRYNPSEGNDLYIVYNDNLNINRSRFEPALPLSNQRQVIVKYSYSFKS